MVIAPNELQYIRETLLNISGLDIPANKAYLVENRLACLLPDYGCVSFCDLFRQAKSSKGSVLADKIIDLMTTNETLWFRDKHPFLIFQERLLSTYLQAIEKGQKKKIRIWSAACSTGQEPYSLAMIILDAMADIPWFTKGMVEIVATDISATCLKKAAGGVYDKVAIGRGLSGEYRKKYFDDYGKDWQVKQSVRDMVRFSQFNLQDNFACFGKFDLVLCRNVAIYFPKQFKAELFAKFASVLDHDGSFILGASESLSGYSSEFEIVQHGRGFYYQLAR